MEEWIYKATKSKVGYYETRHLAVAKHFLCRSAVERNGSQSDRVREVDLGDIIHFYYARGDGKVPSYGSFVVVHGGKYSKQFGERIEGTALFRVSEDLENSGMIRLLTEEHEKDPSRGYARDPEHRCFTGWVIDRLPSSEKQPPKFEQRKLLSGPMTDLWPYPDPELPRGQNR
jgi:hypothetical protein